MSRYVVIRLFLASFIFLLSSSLVSPQSCGGAGYDLSSLTSSDLSFQDPTAPYYYTYYVRPCGNIANSNCSTSSSLTGTMFCQFSPTRLSYVQLATYNSTVSTWLAVSGGVQQIVQDGTYCSAINASRATTLFYHCNNTATTAYISSVTQYQNCHWRATIETRAACTATGATAGHAVGNSFYDSRCGAGVYDLSSVNQQQLKYTSGSGSVSLQLCGPLSASGASSCAQAGSSACLAPSGGAAVSLSAYNASQAVWAINSNGITLSQQNGDYCAASTASTGLTVNIVCNASAAQAQLSAFTSAGEACYYTATVQSAAACRRIDLSSSSSGAGHAGTGSSSGGGSGPSNGGFSIVGSVMSSWVVIFALVLVVTACDWMW